MTMEQRVGNSPSVASSRFFATLFWRMTSVDPVVFGSIAALMLAAALVAAWVPVHRVTRIDPQRALRYE
jgi:putative ABC transport system permease protein